MSSYVHEDCPVCETGAEIEYRPQSGDDVRIVKCRQCGKFVITRTATDVVAGKLGKNRFTLSGVIRNRFEFGETVSVDSRNCMEMVNTARIPSDPLEAIDHLLQFILKKNLKAGEYHPINLSYDFPIVFAQASEELEYYLQKAAELDYLERKPEGGAYRISLGGWKRLAELRSCQRISDQAFVAMSFDVTLNPAWEIGFYPALDGNGFKPLRIDLIEHNEKICDRILAEIRKSGLVVADFTLRRRNVYFEAGFALGLGIPVIWSCRKGDERDIANDFDTRQYNHIIWENEEDLRKKLANRVGATIPTSKSG